MQRPPAYPVNVSAAPVPWPLFDASHTRAIERASLAVEPPHALMARAGLATARLARALAPHAPRVLVLAGPGNNGGDGLVAARLLHEQGQRVLVHVFADPQRFPADAADAWLRATSVNVPMASPGQTLQLQPDDLVIDALLGLGTSRAPEGAMADAIRQVNAAGCRTLAIDLPSGLRADTGQALGDTALRARWTLSLLTLKPGLFTGAGRDHAGGVWFDPLGVHIDEPPTAWLGTHGTPPVALRRRRHAQHKGSFGDVIVVGGAAGMQGAAWLAARAALTAGAGRVYASLLADGVAPAPWPELMTRAQAWDAAETELAAATVVAGCGGGRAIEPVLPALLRHAGRLVLDADALNRLAEHAEWRALLKARPTPAVLTPHPLEAARLLACSVAEVQGDRLAAASKLARDLACVVVLKGSGSTVATPDGPPWINASGNAALATPGSGDVLAGWLGAALAQAPTCDVAGCVAAVRQAVWLHGHAADRACRLRGDGPSPRLPLRALDLVDAMSAAAAVLAA